MRSPTVQESRWVGRILRDKWRIDRRIARGGMGTVFAATHRNNGSTAAIKVLHPEFNRDQDTRSRFLQEGYAANQVSHPGVVRILDDDVTEEGLAFLVMELLEGELLEQRRIRKGGKLPLAEVYELADQLLDVLAAAHAKGIVHRDIKPDNIFLTQQGRLKVLDFGFAQMKSGFRKEQTATGFLLGTPGFMAPEQAIGNRPLIDAQTDIWAVGATLFQLLSGEPVHAGESAAEMLVAAANFPARSITTLEAHLPTKLSQAVDRALAFDKKDRWPDARSMQNALKAVPARQVPAQPIRRSIVDPSERIPTQAITRPPLPGARANNAPATNAIEESTVMDHVEELSEDELHTGETPAYPQILHPADRDGATLAVDSFDQDATLARESPRDDGPTLAVPSPVSQKPDTHRLPPEPHPNEATVIMGARPQAPSGHAFPPYGYHEPQNAFAPQPPQGSQRYGSNPDPLSQDPQLMYAMQTAPAEAASSGGSRVLVFMLVAGITMVVVIITGLLVILASD